MSFTLPRYDQQLRSTLGDTIEHLFSTETELQFAIRFEKALCRAQTEHDLIPRVHASQIIAFLDSANPDIQNWTESIATDGIYVPAFVKEIRARLPQEIRPSFHKDTTSQDLIDSSLMWKLKTTQTHLLKELSGLLESLNELKASIGAREISARTRMQAALPFLLADRIENWTIPLSEIADNAPDYFPLQLGGPIGLMHKRIERWETLAAHVAEELDISAPHAPWHTDRRALLGHCSWFTSISTVLGKFGTDVALMTQNEFGELELKSGGSSSAMPHKSNPVLAEFLVTSAKYNAGLISMIHNASIHEQERSGASWTLEFMVIPQIVFVTANMIAHAGKLVSQLK